MSLARVFTRATRAVAVSAAQSRSTTHLLTSSQKPNPILPLLFNRFHSLSNNNHKSSTLCHGLHGIATCPQCRMSTSTYPEHEQGTTVENKEANQKAEAGASEDAKASQEAHETGSSSETQSTSQSVKRQRRRFIRTAFSDSEGDLDDLSKEDLTKLVMEKEQVLEQKEKEFGEWKDKLLRSYAEMENVMERTRRDAENSKKFAVQSFAKSLLDVADNIGRAASVTRESFNKIDTSKDTVGAVPLLKTLLEGVEMTEKQLSEVFRKAGIEKYDPTDEPFDPNSHNAVFQVPDNSKPPDTVAVVLKAGYMLHDRIIRPAEVGVTVAVENE